MIWRGRKSGLRRHKHLNAYNILLDRTKPIATIVSTLYAQHSRQNLITPELFRPTKSCRYKYNIKTTVDNTHPLYGDWVPIIDPSLETKSPRFGSAAKDLGFQNIYLSHCTDGSAVKINRLVYSGGVWGTA